MFGAVGRGLGCRLVAGKHHHEHHVDQIIDREQGRVILVQPHHVAEVIVAGVFHGVHHQAFGEIPMPAHIAHHINLFGLAWLSPIDDGAARAQFLDHGGVLIIGAKEYEHGQGRKLI